MDVFKDAVKKLEESQIFKDWKKEHKDAYLTSGFSIVEKTQGPWKASYYEESKNKMTSFTIDTEITKEPDEEIFQKVKSKIKGLKLEDVHIELPQAIVLGTNFQKENYKGEDPIKIIAVLQYKDRQIWNLIFISQRFNTLSIRIDTKEGKIVDHKISSILDFKKT